MNKEVEVMPVFEKDKNGNLKRIEYRKKYFRASRTGGVSLRKQLKVVGFNLTGNTSKGVRLSKAVGTGFNVGFQNSRFFMRGRYAYGPFRLNLSKSGASVSTKNKFGSVNWIKPNYSSFKFWGYQVRGENAFLLNIFYIIFSLTLLLIKVILWVCVSLFKILYCLAIYSLRLVWFFILSPFKVVLEVGRYIFKKKAEKRYREFVEENNELLSEIREMDERELAGALSLLYFMGGSGGYANEVNDFKSSISKSLSEVNVSKLDKSERALLKLLNAVDDYEIVGCLVIYTSMRYCEVTGPDRLLSLVLGVDEETLKLGKRTKLQEKFFIDISDYNKLSFKVA